MRLFAAALLLTLPLNGCLFIFPIPVDAISDGLSGNEGRHCVHTAAKVGDTLKLREGGTGTIRKLEGESSRCREIALPIRALVQLD